jgi:sphinganine-1-phosphate aldolase
MSDTILKRIVAINTLASAYSLAILDHPLILLCKNTLLLSLILSKTRSILRYLAQKRLSAPIIYVKSVLPVLFRFIKRWVPVARNFAQGEIDKAVTTIQTDMLKYGQELPAYTRLPTQPMKDEAILKELARYKALEDVDWEHGRVSGAIYSGQADLIALTNKASALFSISNPLHPDIWPVPLLLLI